MNQITMEKVVDKVLEGKLKIEEFCDMDKLYSLLDNWSKSTGMSAVIVDMDGNRTSESFGITEFCQMIHQSEKGYAVCKGTWNDDKAGIYVCPIGFYDMCIPLVLPDGTQIGRVMAGQAMTDEQDAESVLEKLNGLDIPETQAADLLARVRKKPKNEMESAFRLLEQMLSFFIEQSYGYWKAKQDLASAPAKQDRILSQITQIMYSYNLTVDVETGKYDLITGTGMERTIAEYKKQDDYMLVQAFSRSIVHPAYLDRMFELLDIERLRRHFRSGFLGTMEYPVLYPGDEKYEWHEINVFAATDDMGTRTVNILGRDVTEIHELQEKNDRELKAVAAKDQILSEITKQLYSYNLTLNLLTGKYALIVGTGMADFVRIFESTDDYETAFAEKSRLVSPEYREAFAAFSSLAALKAMMNEKGYIGNLEYSTEVDGAVEWHEINVFLGTDENGDPIANILGRDITEAHEAQAIKEKELRAAIAKDQLLSGVTKMLYSYNMTVNVGTGTYTLIKGTGLHETVEMLEATDRYEDIFHRFLDAVDPMYREQSIALLSLESLRMNQIKTGHLGTEEYLMHYTEKPEWHEINVFAGYDENGEAIINILGRDVTEAHDKADTKAQLDIANASNAAKSAFLFNMSHDIRTPMNAIIGFTELLDKHLDDKERARDYIRKIQTSNEFLLSLINNVLEMARIESGKTTLDEAYYNVYDFNDTLFSLFDSQMQEKGITFTREIHVEHSAVICDATKLREIFLNILSNALKYTPSGGKVTMKLTEIPSEKPGYAMYQTVISDTGIGMSEEFLPIMFEEFTRERSSTESKVNGTGLGMAIVKKLVDFMQGTIKVESKIGKGTTFTVVLPHRIAESAERIQPEDVTQWDESLFRDKRILLAEDNALNAEIAVTILEEAGFLVDHAADGILCVDMLEKAVAGTYALILMDIQMPNMDGYKATQTIRKFADPNKANIPIIAMTANAFNEDMKNAYKAGMNGHIAKPINVNELMTTLARILRAENAELR